MDSKQLTLNITRQKNYVGAAMPYRIYIDGVEVATIKIGGRISLIIPNKQIMLKFSMVGNAMAFHKIEKEIIIFPEYCKTDTINCVISTKTDWIGILTGGLFKASGKADIDVQY